MRPFHSYVRTVAAGVLTAGLATLGGCANPSPDAEPTEVPPRRFPAESLDMPADVVVAEPQRNAGRSAYFGDLHVHTNYSFDAFAFGTVATPDDAYRYAQGGASSIRPGSR